VLCFESQIFSCERVKIPTSNFTICTVYIMYTVRCTFPFCVADEKVWQNFIQRLYALQKGKYGKFYYIFMYNLKYIITWLKCKASYWMAAIKIYVFLNVSFSTRQILREFFIKDMKLWFLKIFWRKNYNLLHWLTMLWTKMETIWITFFVFVNK
jgi:hypothetical protein